MTGHIPVLLDSVVDFAREIAVRDGVFVDGTFGRGGHAREIMRVRPDFKIIGIDCDAEAIRYAHENFKEEISCGRLHLEPGNFSDFARLSSRWGAPKIAGVLLDLGVSSPQLDQSHRGFSFYHDGPLDMRMDQSQEITAADIVNTWDERGLNELFRDLGEVRSPYRVTKRILETRKEKPFSTTGELSHLIERTEGWRQKGFHPATNYFMALRIEVNQELIRLEKVMPDIVRGLFSCGRLLIITFHSLEDRIVKTAFKNFESENLGRMVNKKVVQATWEEKKSNPRSRSAKLRVFEKNGGEAK